MTKEEVISKLRDLGVKFHLEFDNIRDDNGRCPIVVIAENTTSETYDNDKWAEAADAAGIEYEDALDIVTAADSEVEPYNWLKSIRDDLLSLCERDK